MKVLVTGALGRVGSMVVEEALKMGYQVRATDLNNPATAALAASFKAQGVEVVLGDLLDQNFLKSLLTGVDAVLHNAAILPPYTEEKPELARKVNIGVTKSLIEHIQQMSPMPRLVFLSSFTIFGPAHSDDSFRRVEDAPNPDSEYTRNKVEGEKMLHASGIPFVILRLGAAIDARESKNVNIDQFKLGLMIAANSPEHWVHPKDVALAQCNAARVPEAVGKTFHIGGDDASCRVPHYELIAAPFRSLGLTLSRKCFGSTRFNGHWLDTTESQRVLQFQRHSFADYQREYDEKFKAYRFLVKPLAFAINPAANWYLSRILKSARNVTLRGH